MSAHNQRLPDSVEIPLEDPQALSEAEFDIIAFESLVGAGVSPVELDVERDYHFRQALEQVFRVNNLNLS